MLRRLGQNALKTAATGVVVVGAAEATTHLPSQGRSSDFYHYLCDSIATPIIRTVLNPEEAHNVAVEMARRGWAPRYRPSLPRYQPASAMQGRWVDTSCRPFVARDPTLVFPNCVGLAAGFDKDGVAIRGLLEMGFGFVEVGSVTPLPQPGNPKPRMFRLTEDRGVINRYGFNSAGIEQVEANLKDFREDIGVRRRSDDTNGGSKDEDVHRSVAMELEGDFGSDLVASVKDYIGGVTRKFMALLSRTPQPRGLVGINVGKNKNSDDEIADYVKGIRTLGPYADYIVINISSPNTPGLRNLQKEEPLRRLLKATVSERDALPPRTREGKRSSAVSVAEGVKVPLLVKIAPDLSEEERVAIAEAVVECRVDGLVVSNTSVSRPDTLLSKHRDERGGLSGAPIRDMSTDCIREMYRLTDGKIPIIGVGGVGSGHDAYEKLRAGASLVQVYSMLVYEGPGLVSRIRKDLECIMRENGHRRVEDIIGLDHDDIYWRKREENMKSIRSNEPVIVSE